MPPPAALPPTQAVGFDAVGGGHVQVAHDAKRPYAAGLRASQGTARGSSEPLAAALMRASIAVFPSALTVRHARGCPGRSTATRSATMHNMMPYGLVGAVRRA